MASGGARARSGPAPDPNALRRNRSDDSPWIVLPREGYRGFVPELPLEDPTNGELAYWEKVWRKPQGVQFCELGLDDEVAIFVRTHIEAAAPGATAGLRTVRLQMADRLGLTLDGMAKLRWKLSEDELARKRDTVLVVKVGPSAKDRLAALADEG
jgi:hypothetical protein